MNEQIPDSQGLGYLVVKVSTARGALPLDNASVNIRGSETENSDIILSLKTNSSGLTEKVALPAPPKVLSESPGIVIPYALYDVDVFKEGYTPLHFTDVAVFDSVTSVQPAIMIPLTENGYSDNYTQGNNFNPTDRETRRMP